jgi:peptidyl-prolyl cis-trans isomerase SurA
MKSVKAICLLAVLALAAGTLSAQPPPPDAKPQLANALQAIVHDSVITRGEVELLTLQTSEIAQRQYRDNPELLQKEIGKQMGENIKTLTEKELILHEFKTAGYSLPESVIDELVQERIKAEFGDRATLTKTLESRGLTYERFRQQVRDRFIVEQLRLKNVSSEIIISPHKVETFYLAHRDEYKIEDQVKLRMIVRNKLADDPQNRVKLFIEELLSKLDKGDSFTELATLYSEGSQRKDGGDWGWVERSVLRPKLAEVAFSLKPGQHSGVIEESDGYYLMLVEDTRPSHFRPLNEVRDSIEKTLLVDEQKRVQHEWIERLRKKTFVRLY